MYFFHPSHWKIPAHMQPAIATQLATFQMNLCHSDIKYIYLLYLNTFPFESYLFSVPAHALYLHTAIYFKALHTGDKRLWRLN